ncbi:MAG: nucleoside deaminase [Alphaproteobacteria bacterium]|nr:nucleoside deaminase [Alphaproteobacteria bacterium]
MTEDEKFMHSAYLEAMKSLEEGGIPIGAVLVIDGKIVAQGHNKRVQKGSAILHAEMDCLENAGRLSAKDYAKATIYSTLSPCPMCSGAIVLYKISRVVIGENKNFVGGEDYLQANGIELVNLDNAECKKMMEDFIQNKPSLWNEDIGI